jgi:hypothetical protein
MSYFSYLRKTTIRNLVSPYGLAFIGMLTFLFAWLFPSGIYSDLLGERDMMFLDSLTLLFFASCVVAFFLGNQAVSLLSPRQILRSEATVASPASYLIMPLIIAIAMAAIFFALIGTKINFLAILLSGQGNNVKLASKSGQLDGGRWSNSLMVLTATLWWSSYRHRQLRLSGFRRILFRIIFVAGVLLDLILCSALVDRTQLMPMVFGLLIVAYYPKTRSVNVSLASLAIRAAAGAVGLIGLFVAMAFLRGTNAIRFLGASIMGYTISPYNRLAALVHGAMHYQTEGMGVYLFPLISSVDRLEGLRNSLGWPQAYVIWKLEFSSIHAVGLNPGYNWAGVFGYIYSDIGWFAPIYLFFAGILAAVLWRQFQAGTTVGLIFYPWMAFWILFWFGWNLLISNQTADLVRAAILLGIYDYFFLRRRVLSVAPGPRLPVVALQP